MSKLNLYQEMRRELEARKAPLTAERERLLHAQKRLKEIDEELDVIDEEIGEYNAAIAPLLPTQNLPVANGTDVETPTD